jgi:hypothetical protein
MKQAALASSTVYGGGKPASRRQVPASVWAPLELGRTTDLAAEDRAYARRTKIALRRFTDASNSASVVATMSASKYVSVELQPP